MKTITIRGFTFMLDDDIYEILNTLHLTVIVSRNKPHLQVMLVTARYSAVSKFILTSDVRTIYKDKNTLNLQRNNLEISTDELRKLKIKCKSKKNYTINKEKIIKLSRQYFQDNKPHKLELQKKYRKRINYINDKKYHRTLKGKYNNLTYCNAKREKAGRVLGINITLEQYSDIIKNPCYYCSKDLFLETGGSLDRIDNSKGYLLDNVLPCCGVCNKIRGDWMTVDETLHVIKCLIEYKKQKENK